MATVTVYEELLGLFRRFGESAARAETIIDVWRKTLDAEDQIVLQILALLRSALGRATDQVSASTILDEVDKEVAVAALRQLDSVVNPNLFHRPAADIAEQVGSKRISMLMLLASSLMSEFPEVTLIRNEIAYLNAEANKLIGIVSNSNSLNNTVRKRLVGQIQFIGWTIRNTEIVGVDALYAAFGPPLLYLRQETVKSGNPNDVDLEPKKAVYQRMEDLFQRVMNRVSDPARRTETVNNDMNVVDGEHNGTIDNVQSAPSKPRPS